MGHRYLPALISAPYLPLLLLLLSPRAFALDCTFGPDPFFFISAELIEGEISSELLAATPLFEVIAGLEGLEPNLELADQDVSCTASTGWIDMPLDNLQMPTVVGSVNYNGHTHDVYPTSEAWAGYIVTQEDGRPLRNGDKVRMEATGPGQFNFQPHLATKIVKLADPLLGTVGQLPVYLFLQGSIAFDLALPDGRRVAQAGHFSELMVNVMGVVCSLQSADSIRFVPTDINTLRDVDAARPITDLGIYVNCGAGDAMVGQRVPDSMQVSFTGGTEAGLLDTEQDNVKFLLRHHGTQRLRFDTTYEMAALSDDSSLDASNRIVLTINPELRDVNGPAAPGTVTGNLGIQVVYK